MNPGTPRIEVESIPFEEMAEALRSTSVFAESDVCELGGLNGSSRMNRLDRVRASAGAVLVGPGETARFYWLVLQGEIRAEKPEADGARTVVGIARAGEGFGEAPMLTGKTQIPVYVLAVRDSLLVRFNEEEFWLLLANCPAARKVVLANLNQRMQAYQAEALHREKLVSLGTMAAGLMHELHNPGSAARRSASQLRENLMRLQELSLRSSTKAKTQEQTDCMHKLLEYAVRSAHAPALSSIAQSEAEEAMSEWLAAAGVKNAYTVGPALVAIGFDRQELDCARAVFEGDGFSDALNWLEALVSSVSLVGSIEESISRVTDLVMAVKKFAYDERSVVKETDIHESLQSTLTLMGHKMRLKGIEVEKCFSASPSTIMTKGSALSQVWTNLIDNALDASPEGARIEVATWVENAGEGAASSSKEPVAANGSSVLAISVLDHGSGIPPEVVPHIFEAFYTTKAPGAGTGLGLEIVHRIVTQKYGGTITVESRPGRTRFVVRLPLNEPGASVRCAS
jgi:signal transduction histidine kinase